MPRKSARLLSKSKLRSQDTDEDNQPSKRRKMEEAESRISVISQTRQQFRIQNKWQPTPGTSCLSSMVVQPNVQFPAPVPPMLPRPDPRYMPGPAGDANSPKKENVEDHIYTAAVSRHSHFRFSNHFRQPALQRLCPLPHLDWGDPKEVWEAMMKKEQLYQHSHQIFSRHPQLEPRMRAILFEWMVEVCEVYRLHKETMYLAMDFIDRYLSIITDMPKSQLQLLGITALFVASKLDEIYPPKVADFAFVTDGACTADEIKDYELVLCKALNWELSPMTADAWLQLYLQLLKMKTDEQNGMNALLDDKENMEEEEEASNSPELTDPKFSVDLYMQVSRLMDLAMWEVDCLQFSYSVIAATALHHMGNLDSVTPYTGLNWADMLPCVTWMAPFTAVVRSMAPAQVKFFSTVKHYDAHNIQTKTVSMSLFDRALELLKDGGATGGYSNSPPRPHQPQLNMCMSPQPSASLITPPRSSRKTTEMEH